LRQSFQLFDQTRGVIDGGIEIDDQRPIDPEERGPGDEAKAAQFQIQQKKV